MSVVTILTAFGMVLFGMGTVLFLITTNKNRTKTCPGCKNVIPPNTNSCPYCGYIFH